MKLENRFTVPVPRAQALAVLLDVERIAPCMPGATLTSRNGDHFTGNVKVKLGPISLTYGGQASFVSVDEVAGVVVIEGTGKETRGTGTAKAVVTCRLLDRGATTEVQVETDLAITGKPAQFGRGVLADVSGQLVDQFASCLSKEIQAGVSTLAGSDMDAAARLPAGGSAVREAAPIDLLAAAGNPLLKRLLPVGVVLLLLLLLLLVRRLRTARKPRLRAS
jgi:carbon monoxide dehydrogenase subunit G